MIDTLKLIRAVLNGPLKQSEKLALIACIYKVDWRTWAADFPISISNLCEETGMGRATVKRALKALESFGYIHREGTQYRGGQGASTLSVNASLIISNNKEAQIEPPSVQIEPTPRLKLSPPLAQIEPPSVQIEPHIYPDYSTPNNLVTEETCQEASSLTSTQSMTMKEYLAYRAKEEESWQERKRSITQ